MHAKCKERDLQVSFNKWTKFCEIAYTKGILLKKKKKLISRRISQQSVCRLYVVCQEAPFFLVGVENHYDNLA